MWSKLAMYKLTVFIPDSALQMVKEALFAAGAGQVGHYSHCCWQVQGMGQFMPLAGSQPYLGQQGKIEEVVEWRVEMLVKDEDVENVTLALKKAHPYETPAYDFVLIQNGRVDY